MHIARQPCRRLIAAGCLPGRAGQPTTVQLHMTLDQLRGQDDTGAEDAWAAERASMTGWLDGPGAVLVKLVLCHRVSRGRYVLPGHCSSF